MPLKEINHLATTNKLLLILVVPFVFYLLQILSFIFVPLVLALIISLVFLPYVRWTLKRNIPKWLTVGSILIFLFIVFRFAFYFIKLSSKEIISVDAEFWNHIFNKLNEILLPLLELLGYQSVGEENSLSVLLHSEEMGATIYGNVGKIINVIQSTLTMLLMALFFVVLILAGSVNFKDVMQDTIFKTKMPANRTLFILEKSIVKFLVVKFLISLATGVGFGLACYFFDVKFPVFWGLFAFAVNFIQMVGSIISTVLLALFSIAQFDSTGTLLAFVFTITGVQVLFGSILEPVFMGKTFSINTITILVMLMLWGFLWGIPGLILAVPLTVVIKTILQQFPRTMKIAKIMS